MKYCENCNQNVEESKKFSMLWFLVNCIWLIGGVVYIIYYLFMKKKSCPICRNTHLEHQRDIIDGVVSLPTISKLDQALINRNEFNATLKERVVDNKARMEMEKDNRPTVKEVSDRLKKERLDRNTAKKLAKLNKNI